MDATTIRSAQIAAGEAAATANLRSMGLLPPEPASEVLEWHDAATDKPDSDTTVLCWGSEGFFCGYWDDSIPGWIGCESGGSVIGVTHWSNPEGPQ